MAKVKILLKGYFKWTGLNKFKASSTVVLIKDQDKNIVFDTGSIEEEGLLNRHIRMKWLTPEEVDILIISHYHFDHIGNIHLFKNAEIIDSNKRYLKGVSSYGLFNLLKSKIKLTENVTLYKTPGHTSDSISLLVKTKKGMIGITGDLFVKHQKENVLHIENKAQFKRYRKKIIKKCDYIIPGHGDIFKVQK